jgi:hypothetical protein
LKFIFGTIGYSTGLNLRLNSENTILTRHARKRMYERVCHSDPEKELNKILSNSVLINQNERFLKLSNGFLTTVCSIEKHPHPIITVRHSNDFEKMIFAKYHCRNKLRPKKKSN